MIERKKLMSETMETAHHCSSSLTLSTATIHLFRASLLCLLIISTFYLHPCLCLPLISPFLFPNISSLYRKITIYRGSTQLMTKHDDDKIQHSKVRDESQDRLCSGPKDSHSLIISCDGHCTSHSKLCSSSSSSLYDELDEDYVIEVTLPEQRTNLEDKKRHELTESEDADVNEIVLGEDSMIEIDISMGLIRH